MGGGGAAAPHPLNPPLLKKGGAVGRGGRAGLDRGSVAAAKNFGRFLTFRIFSDISNFFKLFEAVWPVFDIFGGVWIVFGLGGRGEGEEMYSETLLHHPIHIMIYL